MKWFLVSWLLLGLIGCSKEQFVAKVLDRKITPAEFTSRYQQYLAAVSGRDNIQLRKQILNNMINEILILHEVEREGLTNDSAAVKRLDEIRTQAVLTV